MIEHRAAVKQQFVEQEAEALRRRNLVRQRALDRLWAIADASPENTRGSFTNQIKAISMIVTIEGISLSVEKLNRMQPMRRFQ